MQIKMIISILIKFLYFVIGIILIYFLVSLSILFISFIINLIFLRLNLSFSWFFLYFRKKRFILNLTFVNSLFFALVLSSFKPRNNAEKLLKNSIIKNLIKFLGPKFLIVIVWYIFFFLLFNFFFLGLLSSSNGCLALAEQIQPFQGFKSIDENLAYKRMIELRDLDRELITYWKKQRIFYENLNKNPKVDFSWTSFFNSLYDWFFNLWNQTTSIDSTLIVNDNQLPPAGGGIDDEFHNSIVKLLNSLGSQKMEMQNFSVTDVQNSLLDIFERSKIQNIEDLKIRIESCNKSRAWDFYTSFFILNKTEFYKADDEAMIDLSTYFLRIYGDSITDYNSFLNKFSKNRILFFNNLFQDLLKLHELGFVTNVDKYVNFEQKFFEIYIINKRVLYRLEYLEKNIPDKCKLPYQDKFSFFDKKEINEVLIISENLLILSKQVTDYFKPFNKF